MLKWVTVDVQDQVTINTMFGLSNVTAYLDLFGRLLVGLIWLRQTLVTRRALETGVGVSEADFYRGKLHAARYFMSWELAGLDLPGP